jgi:hypothetical protein
MVDRSEKFYQEQYSQYADFEKIIQDEYEIIGRVLAAKIAARFSSTRIVALDVGAGTGRMPKTLFRLSKDHQIIFDYMDPVASALRMYEDSVSPECRGIPIQSDWASYEPDKQYDLVLANNSFCGIDCSDEGTIRKISAITKKKGLSLIVLPSQRGDWVQYAQKYWKSVHQTPFSKTIFEDFAQALAEYSVQHTEDFVEAPVTLPSIDDEHILSTVFAVMMYVNRTEIPKRWNDAYVDFSRSVRKQGKLKFVYGIAECRPDEK